MFVINVGFSRAFPTWFNVCDQAQEPTLEWGTCILLHSGKLWPYPKILEKEGGGRYLTGLNTLAYFEHSLITDVKKIDSIGPELACKPLMLI
jgi:hypothetical protein